jgi:hypothetical protein
MVLYFILSHKPATAFKQGSDYFYLQCNDLATNSKLKGTDSRYFRILIFHQSILLWFMIIILIYFRIRRDIREYAVNCAQCRIAWS